MSQQLEVLSTLDGDRPDREHLPLANHRPARAKEPGERSLEPGVAASFGTYNIMWQIEQCRSLELPYLYLGYWINSSRKMAYKANFQPIEGLIDGEWRRLGDEDLA